MFELLVAVIVVLLYLLISGLPLFLILFLIFGLFFKKPKKDHIGKEDKPHLPDSEKYNYPENEYFEQTHLAYFDVYGDEGRLGEYTIYLNLRNIIGYRKFIFNLYIPNENGSTAEIDVLMIHRTGIYVFESKNYSGWIFGSVTQKTWTQCLYSRGGGQKYHFYNPVRQNAYHVRCLRNLLKQYHGCKTPVFSYIVFGDKCEFKNDDPYRKPNHVVFSRDLLNEIYISSPPFVLSDEQINELFNFLYPYSQVSDDVRQQHIDAIRTIYPISDKTDSQGKNERL